MINREELDICRRRGHGPLTGPGWSPCESCGLWRRDQRTIEERDDEPAEGEADLSRPARQTRIGSQSPEELLICRRRGHSRPPGLGWSRCDLCGFWLREHLTVEEREDEPPEDEMSLEIQSTRILDRVKRRMDELGEQRGSQ